MKKAVFLTALLIGLGFSAITLEQAGDKAMQYQESGETIDIAPRGLTYSGTNAYWVIELLGPYRTINVMLPFNSETGNLEVSDSVKDVLKTHYLANYFSTDDTIPDFLEGTLSYAQGKKTDFTNALQQLGVYEVQLPSDVTLANLEPLKDSLTNANDNNDKLRSQIQGAQTIVSSTNWRTTYIDSARSSLNSVFSKEETFLDNLDDAATNANALLTELAGNSDLLTNYPSLVQAFQGVITSYKLTEGAPVKTRDALTSNKNTVNSFFDGLDLTAGQYLKKLRDRYSKYIDPDVIRAVQDSITAYSSNYTYIYSNAHNINPFCDDDITKLKSYVDEAQSYFNKKNYTEAQIHFGDIDDLIDKLTGPTCECPSTCPGGKVVKNCECVCPEGTEEVGGKCVSTGFGLNLPLIGGLILIIVLLMLFKYKDKIFPGGGEVEEKPKDMWSGYKF